MKNPITACMAAVLWLSIPTQAATIIEDFEGELTDGSAPSGWALVDTGSGVYSTTAGTGNPGQSGEITFASRGNSNTPSTYIVNSGVAFDATQAFSGSFDFFVIEGGNYSNLNFILGDVQDGLSNSAGEYINVLLDEIQFGSRADILDGNGTVLLDGSGNNNYVVTTGEWNNVTSFTWTPTSGTTGNFTINWDNSNAGTESMSITGYTFTSNEVFFGFGGGDTSGRFDNINITGTAIPEPSVALLSGLGVLMLLRRRKH